jgi:hypothetical protein
MTAEPIRDIDAARAGDTVRGPDRRLGPSVLTVRLLFRPHSPAVGLALAVPAAPQAGPVHRLSGRARTATWEVAFREFEVPGRPEALALPAGLIETIREQVDALAGLPPGQPLWLKLARPYGMLGTLPWERELGRALKCPVLRLPDYTAPPARRPDILESALLVDPGPPAEVDVRDVLARTRSMVSAILRASVHPGSVVHLFTTAAWHGKLARLGRRLGRVRVHDPAATQTSSAALAAEAATPFHGLRSAPWADWIAAEARGIDAIHLLCRAHRTDTGAEIVLSSSPSPKETRVALTVIDENELLLLLTRAGAWSISFVPVVRAQSQAVAFVADSVAHRSAGAVLFHRLPERASAATLASAFEFLYGTGSGGVPLLAAGFMYCHPSQTRLQRSGGQRGAYPVLTEHAALFARGVPGAPPMAPNWVGSTQRFLESAVFHEVRKGSGDILLSQMGHGAGPDRRTPSAAPDSCASTTLHDIQDVVAAYLKSHESGEPQ